MQNVVALGDWNERTIYAQMAALGFPLRKWDPSLDDQNGHWPGRHVVDLGCEPDGSPHVLYVDDLGEWWALFAARAYLQVRHQLRLKWLRGTWDTGDEHQRAQIQAWFRGCGPEPAETFLGPPAWTRLMRVIAQDDCVRWIEILAECKPHALCGLTMAGEKDDLRVQIARFAVAHERSALSGAIAPADPVARAAPRRL